MLCGRQQGKKKTLKKQKQQQITNNSIPSIAYILKLNGYSS